MHYSTVYTDMVRTVRTGTVRTGRVRTVRTVCTSMVRTGRVRTVRTGTVCTGITRSGGACMNTRWRALYLIMLGLAGFDGFSPFYSEK